MTVDSILLREPGLTQSEQQNNYNHWGWKKCSEEIGYWDSKRRRIKGKKRGLEETFEENSDHSNLDHEYTHPIKWYFQGNRKTEDKSSKMWIWMFESQRN